MDEWQETAFSSRHMHNRNGRNNGRATGKAKRNKEFDVRKTLGSYTCKCPAWFKSTSGFVDEADREAVLELYRLTENGQGIVGEISLPGAVRAAVILAASRRSMQTILSELEPDELNEDEDEDNLERRTSNDNTTDSDREHGEDDDVASVAEPDPHNDDEDFENEPESVDRFATFEKNSFREPKFWLQWNGQVSATSTASATTSATTEMGLGYIVFTSNDCRKFKGTFNCASLDWKDVSLTGQKIAPRSESDIPVTWGEGEVRI